MKAPVIRFLLSECHRDGHLRHHRRATAPNQTLIEKDNRRAAARGSDGRIHPGAAGANDQYVC
jgi:hypothetical protein